LLKHSIIDSIKSLGKTNKVRDAGEKTIVFFIRITPEKARLLHLAPRTGLLLISGGKVRRRSARETLLNRRTQIFGEDGVCTLLPHALVFTRGACIL